MFRIFSIFFLLFSLGIQAQNDAFTNEVHEEGGKVFFEGKPFSGNLYDDVPGVPNDCECTLKAQYKNGLLHGTKQTWYPNGKFKEVAKYKNGIITEKKSYYKNGKIRKQEKYKDGKPVSAIIYNKDGRVKKTSGLAKKQQPKKPEKSKKEKVVVQNTPVQQTTGKQAETGEVSQPEKTVEETKKKPLNVIASEGGVDGLEKELYPDGKVKRVLLKRDGLIVKDSLFNPSGKLQYAKKYSDGELIHAEEYNEEGKLIKEFNFLNNKKEGVQIENFPDGSPQLIEKYTNGFLTHREIYHSKGFLLREENYSFNKKDGVQKEYDNEGNLIRFQEYKMGIIIRDEKYTDEGKELIKIVDGLAEIKLYNKKNQLLALKYEDVKTQAKDSLWLTFDPLTGNKLTETAYVKQKKVREGKYENNQKEGVWHYYWVNGKKETWVEYHQGKKVSEKTLTYAKQLKNNYKEGDNLFNNKRLADQVEEYLLLLKTDALDLSDEARKKMLQHMQNLFNKYYDKVSNPQSKMEDELSVVLTVNKLDYQIKPKKEGSKKVVFLFDLDMEIKDYDVDKTHSKKLVITPVKDSGKSLKSYYTRNKQEAFEATLENFDIQFTRFLFSNFPVQGRIAKVLSENKEEVKEVSVYFVDPKQIQEDEILYVLNDAHQPGAQLLVKKINNEHLMTCKVIEGKEWLKTFMQKNKRPSVVRTYTFK